MVQHIISCVIFGKYLDHVELDPMPRGIADMAWMLFRRIVRACDASCFENS